MEIQVCFPCFAVGELMKKRLISLRFIYNIKYKLQIYALYYFFLDLSHNVSDAFQTDLPLLLFLQNIYAHKIYNLKHVSGKKYILFYFIIMKWLIVRFINILLLFSLPYWIWIGGN